MEACYPRVLFSSFRPISPAPTVQKSAGLTSDKIMVVTDNNIETVCPENPRQLELAHAIWQEKTESSGDLSPIPPMFPEPSASATEMFVTPQLVETEQMIPNSEKTVEPIFNAWLGTNVIIRSKWTIEQSKSILQDAIARRAVIESITYESPYDPEGWLHQVNIYFELCFNDLQVASAHKAIYLITQGLDLKDQHFGKMVRAAIGMRLSCFSSIVITDELQRGLIEAYKGLLRGLLEMSAYWEGLKEAKRALEIMPGDKDLLLLQKMMKEEHKLRAIGLKESKHSADEIKQLNRIGRSYKRKYPWLEENLFIRPQSLLKEISRNFNSVNCEVRPLYVTQNDTNTEKSRSSRRSPTKISKQQQSVHHGDNQLDVGPLGVFAKRTIHKGEELLIDRNLSIVPSNPPHTLLLQCDACHALLVPPFHNTPPLLAPCCPTTTAFCSTSCQTAALAGYHQLICNQDFTWLHRSATSRSLDPSWQPAALLRILAIVVADLRSLPPTTHPLQHPLLARLTAGYEADAEQAQEQVWNYLSHVVAPTRILAQLGVDVFADRRWSAEVLHCVYWRVVNNACCVRGCTVVEGAGGGDGLETVQMAGIAPGYVFFNHTCGEDGAWWAAGGSVEAGKRRGCEGARGDKEDGGMKVGCNAVVCVARRDYKEGEEVRISYLPVGKRRQLVRWFEGGQCTCGVCDGALADWE